jgi:outer membrane protein assembly factor BamE (lipoprotein component of BamABCDE complex)
MKKLHLVFVLFVLFAGICFSGCATSTATSGHDFDSATVSQIQKGVTTTEQLVQMFGPPYSKTVKSETDEEWSFQYAVATAKARAGFLGDMKVETTGHQKTLNVLIRGGVAINYTFNEGPIEQKSNTQTYK